jgi:hypothetical protein
VAWDRLGFDIPMSTLYQNTCRIPACPKKAL